MITDIPTIVRAFKNNGIEIVPNNSIDDTTSIPCITYRENNNAEEETGDTVGYSSLQYIFEVWHREFSELVKLCKRIDAIMRSLGYKRTNTAEQSLNNLTRKIITYEKNIYEKYEEE